MDEMLETPRFAKIIFGVVLAATVGCFGIAASTLTSAGNDAGIVSVPETSASTQAPAPRIRIGTMTERVHSNAAAELARLDR